METTTSSDIEAIKSTCQGERRLNGGNVCQKITVPADYSMFDSDTGVSAISERVGIPVYTITCAVDRRLLTKSGDIVNVPATFMNITIDPDSGSDPLNNISAFGWAPDSWQSDVANVLMVRQDRKPLDPNVAEAFGAYCQLHLGTYFQWCGESEGERGEEGDMRFKGAVLAEITPERWATYLEQWRYVKERGEEKDAGWGEATGWGYIRQERWHGGPDQRRGSDGTLGEGRIPPQSSLAQCERSVLEGLQVSR